MDVRGYIPFFVKYNSSLSRTFTCFSSSVLLPHWSRFAPGLIRNLISHPALALPRNNCKLVSWTQNKIITNSAFKPKHLWKIISRVSQMVEFAHFFPSLFRYDGDEGLFFPWIRRNYCWWSEMLSCHKPFTSSTCFGNWSRGGSLQDVTTRWDHTGSVKNALIRQSRHCRHIRKTNRTWSWSEASFWHGPYNKRGPSTDALRGRCCLQPPGQAGLNALQGKAARMYRRQQRRAVRRQADGVWPLTGSQLASAIRRVRPPGGTPPFVSVDVHEHVCSTDAGMKAPEAPTNTSWHQNKKATRAFI